MPDTNRFGAAVDVLSRRVNVTVLAFGLSAFREMNTRPVAVAAHSVEWFCGERASDTT